MQTQFNRKLANKQTINDSESYTRLEPTQNIVEHKSTDSVLITVIITKILYMSLQHV